jgi:hypothetical protein
MLDGIAIKPNIESNALTIMPVAQISAKELTLIDVFKCPICGHSESKTILLIH